MSQFEAQEEAAVAAALSAGRLIQRFAGRLDDTSVREKGTHDLVTEIDEEAQHIIVTRLRDRFPDYAILAEEGEFSKQELVAGGFRWIVDPIDGTTNFLHGVPPYAVSIALQHQDKLVLGVVLDVSRDELFTAVRGGGLYVNGRRATVSRTRELSEALITTGFPFRAFDRIDGYLAAMRRLMKDARGIRRPGSASVDLAYVAAGRFDAFFETHLGVWDVAAGIVLVEEAGGRVTDFGLNDMPLHGREILASNGALHNQMHERISPLRRSDSTGT